MLRIVYFVALLSICFQQIASGLECWSCKDARNNEECIEKGKMEICSPKQTCVNRVISKSGGHYVINKGCNIGSANCRKTDNQNSGMYPYLCKTENEDSTCQCCCDSDLCNGPQTECKKAITCHKPDRPNNGILKCPRAISFGSRCIVKCLAGYKRQGSRVITCMKTSNESTQGFWKPDKPISCMYYKESSCKETMQEPKHGSVVCENSEQFMKSKKSNHIGTICAFTCDSGYYIHGQSTSKCLDGGQWTSAVPTCVRGMCQEPVQDSHRIESCTDKYGIGSVCTLSCETGYKLIGNASSITCVSVSDDVQRGKWSNEFSKCEISECRPKLQNPSNGRVECTNKNIEGSVCTFSCERGYDLSGTDGKTLETECRNDGDSTSWTVAAPTCQVRRCPRLEKPENGDVLCQNGRIVGSKCTFTCNMGFDLAESSTPSMETICRKNISGGSVGSWTVQTVTCEPIVCEPEPQNPVNGVVTCSKGNSLGSICTYSCVFLYDLDGTTEKYITTQCKDGDGGDGKGIWFGEPGTCYKKIACGTQQKEPENGSVKCSDGNYMFSECEFACKEGYVMKGVPHTYCVDLKNDGDAVAEWTNPAPKCEIGICLPKWYDERTMIESCSNTKVDGGYPVGTNCQYSCKDKGFFLQFGVDVNLENGITCLPSKEWSELSHPRCSRSACDPLAEIPFGYFICSNGFNYGTECQFQCENKYTPSISEPLTCQEDSSNPKRGSWDKESPKCMLNECAKIPSNPKMGLITCTNQLKVGSKCTLKCEPGYAPIMKEIRCKTGNGDSVPTFGPMDKFCCAECKNDMEVVQIVDARFSSNLKKVTEFTKTMINALAVESSDIGFSSFIYNDEVFTDSMIQRTELSITGTSISNIIEHISGWKLMSEGKDSDHRSALRYVKGEMFSALSDDATKILLLFADSAPHKVSSSVVKEFKSQGVRMLVVTSDSYVKITWDNLIGSENVIDADLNTLLMKIREYGSEKACNEVGRTCV